MPGLRLEPAAPYSLERTVAAFARFPDESVDIVVPGGYRRAFDIDGDLVLVEARQEASPDGTSGPVMLQVLAPGNVTQSASRRACQYMRTIISAEERISAVEEQMRSDTRLAGLIPRLSGLRRTLDPTPFEGLVSSILAQLISVRGAATVRARLVQRFGRSIAHDGRSYWAFPEPGDVAGSSVDELCQLKMTSAKARAILAVAQATLRGELRLSQLRRHSDQEVARHLTTLPGIGQWTAEWFLINVMGRMVVVPAGDLGIRRSTGHWLLGGEMPSPEAVRSVYEPFGEQRAYVAYYVLSAERHGLE